jgi:four helix bundle protein
MARAKNFHDLIVWQKAMALARVVYAATQDFPKAEMFGLQSQIRRAVVSIAANIAEGHGRLTDMQFRHFLGNARGSLCELQTELELAHDLNYVSTENFGQIIQSSIEVARLLNGLISSMSSSPTNSAAKINPSSANTANPANTASSANTASLVNSAGTKA